MKLLLINATPLLAANPFVERFKEGGPVAMTLILICLILSLFFIVKGFLNSGNEVKVKKMIALTTDASLLGLVLGFFASIIGLITAFDSLEAIDGMANSGMFAGGLKVSLLTTVFGSLVFIIGRIGIFILRWRLKS